MSGPVLPSLKKNFSWTFLGNSFYAACQWAMLIVIAKLGDPRMVGQFSLGLAITAPIILFTNLQLRGIQSTDTGSQYTLGDYLGLRLVMLAIACAIFTTISLTSGMAPETSTVVILVGLSKVIESIIDICYGLLQRLESMKDIAKSLILRGTLSVTGLAAGIYVTHQLVYGIIALAIAWLFCLLLVDLPCAHQKLKRTGELTPIRPRLARKSLISLAVLALPLGFASTLISLNGNMPRYLIEQDLGDSQLGIYAAIAYVIVAGNTLISALGQSSAPRLARLFQDDKDAFKALLHRLLLFGAAIGFAGTCLVYLAGEQLLEYFYGHIYAEHHITFLLLAIASIATYMGAFLGYGMTAARCFKPQVPLFLTCTLVCYTLGSYAIPAWGLQGAALTTLITACVQAAGSGAVIWFLLRGSQALKKAHGAVVEKELI